ncbi:Ultrabithorax [Carabus blaptoides fortunei]
MNSYFEQSGFYGTHHHQSTGTGSTSSHHHDQTTAAAYRPFPLPLGMSPYASTQHHHHHGLHQARPPQDSPYDASVTSACKLYSSSTDAQQNSVNYSTSGSKSDCSKGTADQNGYASVVAAAAIKDVWQSTGGSANVSANSLIGPVRPAACTPDSRVAYGSSVGLVGGDPASSPGAAGGGRTTNSLSSWNNAGCTLNTTTAQPVATQIHQQTNHTFYPWMAIAGECRTNVLPATVRDHATVDD